MATRTLKSGRNSAQNFQGRVAPCFDDMDDSLKAMNGWFCFSQQNQTGLACLITHIFCVCHEQNLKVSARKTKLFLSTLKWCGRIIIPHGVRLDPRNEAELTKCTASINAAELCKYVHCISLMQNRIPDHVRLTTQLQTLLEEAYTKTGKCTKRNTQSITFSSLGWCETHKTACNDIQKILDKQIFLAHRDPELQICVFTGTSDLFWASTVTRCKASERTKQVSEQRHQPLAFLLPAFNNTNLGWTTFEKGGFAILHTFCRLDDLLLCEALTRVFTEHRNILFVFCPELLAPSLDDIKLWRFNAGRFISLSLTTKLNTSMGILMSYLTLWLVGFADIEDSRLRWSASTISVRSLTSYRPQAV